MKKLLLLTFFACITLARAEKAPTQLTWYGHSAFKITTPNGRIILVDPWISNLRHATLEWSEDSRARSGCQWHQLRSTRAS